MFAQDIVSYINGWSVAQHNGLDDLADRANFHGNIMVLLLCTILVSVRQYFMQPMVCYVSSVPGGSNSVNYLTDMCWVEGTIPLNFSVKISHRVEDWEKLNEYRMSYYQWVPFVLGLQAVLYYIPRIIWQMFTYSRAGMDLEQLARDSSEADCAPIDSDIPEKIAEHVSRNIEIMLFGHRRISKSKKSFKDMYYKSSGMKSIWRHLPGKRNGNLLVTFYIGIKLLYVTVGFFQLWLMYVFLRLDQREGYRMFGHRILQDLMLGRDWSATQIFPRVGICRHPLEQLGNINRAVAQCLLPINMLNEKIYIFLFFFLSSVLVLTIISIPLWLYRIGGRSSQKLLVLHCLKVATMMKVTTSATEAFANAETGTSNNANGQLVAEPLINLESMSCTLARIDRFVVEFLRQDGNFILRMLSMNAGDLTTSRLVERLYRIYCEEGYIHCDLRNPRHWTQYSNDSSDIFNQPNNQDFNHIRLEPVAYARVNRKENVDSVESASAPPEEFL